MEGAFILIVIALVIVAAFAWNRRSRPASRAWHSIANVPEHEREAQRQAPELTKDQVGLKVYHELGRMHLWWLAHEPPEVFTIYMDITPLVNARPWGARPDPKLIWGSVVTLVPFFIRAAFGADFRIQTVRFRYGNGNPTTTAATCSVSVEAKRASGRGSGAMLATPTASSAPSIPTKAPRLRSARANPPLTPRV